MNFIHCFQSIVSDELLQVEKIMHDQANGYHSDFKNALTLIFSAGGKRIRPNITLLSGKLMNADMERLIILSAAIELLHTATLVHDDLIDGSLLRRGTPTLNSQWSPAATVLTGDFIFAKAAKLATETNSIPVMNLFADTVGTIVNGELNQLFSSKSVNDLDLYYQCIYAKTASLFETSTTSAGLIAEAGKDQIELLRQYGYELGIAFQIVDDILDFTGDEEKIGKPVGTDLRSGLITLPSILFFNQYPNDPLTIEYNNSDCNPQSTIIEELILKIRNSPAIPSSLKIAQKHIDQCISALHKLPKCIERDALEEIAVFTVTRTI